MSAKEYVDSLFEGYEGTAALEDFKEELTGNLNAKIESFIRKGMDPEAAFAKASAELGDVSALADELSLKKRREVFEEVYMDIRRFMPSRRVAAYVIFGILALFGAAAALITFFAEKGPWTQYTAPFGLTSFFATMMPFLTAAITGFTFLGVTQETASAYPVSGKRGAWYAASAGLIAFGLLMMPVAYFGDKFPGGAFFQGGPDINIEALIPVIGLMIPFVLPGGGLLAFLVLTEKDRLKPWAKSLNNKIMNGEMALWNDPATASRFGMFSGAIWIFAAGLFALLGFLIGFRYSWLVFIFATAFQLAVQGFMVRKGKDNASNES
ncbi:MAG: permease prefix domain 1-containing protein [Treponema sp.]|nr:permease prefix domain 1-containing protein [Treponema sp.]